MKSSDMIDVLVNLVSGTLGAHPMFPPLGLGHAHNSYPSANPIMDKVELVELLVTTLRSNIRIFIHIHRDHMLCCQRRDMFCAICKFVQFRKF